MARGLVEQILGQVNSGRVVAPEVWRDMAEQGWLGVCLPTSQGGLDGSLADLGTLAYELGRNAVTSPLAQTAAVVAALYRYGAAGALEILPLVCSGAVQVLPVWQEIAGGGGFEARQSPSGWELNGHAPLVEFLKLGTHLLVGARISGQEEAGLFMVALPHPAILSEGLGDSVSAAPVTSVTCDAVWVPSPFLPLPDTERVKRDTEQLTVALVCQELAGLGRRMVEMSVEYARSRVQFGRPIGSFQAVQHLLADMHIEVELASLAADRLLAALDDTEDDAARWVDVSSALASSYIRCALDAHEVFAGVGFIKDHPLHLYVRRVLSLCTRLAPPGSTNAARALRAVAG